MHGETLKLITNNFSLSYTRNRRISRSLLNLTWKRYLEILIIWDQHCLRYVTGHKTILAVNHTHCHHCINDLLISDPSQGNQVSIQTRFVKSVTNLSRM